MHESVPASFSMLPLAQRLVSIEAQDDYQVISSKLKGHTAYDRSMPGQISSAWDNFVDKAWDVFFENRHQKLNADQNQQTKEIDDANSQKQSKRQQQQHQQQQQYTRRETRDNESADH
ncbi:MAG: hypothetical protein GY874_15010, partial [Desulfobacteraceae bacterium]|nr:hypothetical protein [Desulfobacteraceae bacterium]